MSVIVRPWRGDGEMAVDMLGATVLIPRVMGSGVVVLRAT